ncbi:MAG: DUF11 domain-containing protein [Frankia sp.]|nr:DUF11 domain-containing protein [Frankia sp.]
MKKTLAVLSAIGVAVLAVPFAGPAQAQVPFARADFSGYATGTVVHVDAVQQGTTQLANAEVSFSGASVASKGTGGITFGPNAKPGTLVNDFGEVVQPSLPGAGNLAGNKSFGRGSGLEVGLSTTLPNQNPSVINNNTVRVSAPPSVAADTHLLEVPANPVAYAQAVRGAAAANWNNNTCVLGKPISSGLGYSARVQVLNTGAGGPGGTLTNPVVATESQNGAVNQSLSTTTLVGATTSDRQPIASARGLGLQSETRQIMAPVSLFENTANQITVEVLGEWVLRAVAGGVNGSAYMRYAPDDAASPTTPVVSITTGQDPTKVQRIITLQDITGNDGITVPAGPLATATIGVPPKKIGDPSKPAEVSADGTSAAGAVDIVRVKLGIADPTTHLADVAIGHMEARARVPKGGIDCPIPVSKTADPQVVKAGGKFTYTITIRNPFDCVLQNVRVVDTIRVDAGIKYKILSTTPTASISADQKTLTFANIGDIQPGGTRQLFVEVSIPLDSAAGLFHNTAAVTATCASGKAGGGAEITVPLTGLVRVNVPEITPAAPAKRLPRTGTGTLVGFSGALLLSAAGAVTVARRRMAVTADL